MTHIYPFQAIHPPKERAQDIAAVPYDVVDAKEAAEIIKRQPDSFLRISRSDSLLSGDPYCDLVYAVAKSTFDQYLADGLLIKDNEPSLYIYSVTAEYPSAGKKSFTGLCGCFSLNEYKCGIIRKHELTRIEKEQDRTRHIDAVNANTGPVIFLHQKHNTLSALLSEEIKKAKTPSLSATAPDNSLHEIYQISDPDVIQSLISSFADIAHLYIADGHHRCKSALNVLEQREVTDPKQVHEETKRVMGVAFAESEVLVYGYHRLILAHNNDPDTFIQALKKIAKVTEYQLLSPSISQIPPHGDTKGFHIFHLYYKSAWYEVAIPKEQVQNPVDALDVTVLQNMVLEPLLHITDPRTDPMLQYVGGSSPVSLLMQSVDKGEATFAIAMQPVSVADVRAIADAGEIMPPKSTWFEPKMLSGLTVHLLS